MYRNDLIGLSLAKEANIDLLYVGRSIRNAILASSDEQRAHFLADADKQLAMTRDNLDKARPLFYPEKGKATFAEPDRSWKDYEDAVGQMRAKASAATMQEVVSAIQRVTDIVGEISAASSEQSLGVAQVGQAVSQMDQVTQQNAALVEESAAAAESLKSQSAQLVAAVAVFRLKSDAKQPGAALTSRPAYASRRFGAPLEARPL